MKDIEDIKKAISSYLSKNIDDLTIIYIFGSAAKNNLKENSDIDCAFYAKPDYSLSKSERLEILFNHKSNLFALIKQDIDLVDLSLADPIISFQVFQNGQAIYKTNDQSLKQEFENFKVFKLNEYYDFKIERRQSEEELKSKRII